MKLILDIHSLPELAHLSKADKKRALKACQWMPYKDWKVLLSLLLLFFVPMTAKITSALIMVFGKIESHLADLVIYSVAQIVYTFIVLIILMQFYTPIIRKALQDYLIHNNKET